MNKNLIFTLVLPLFISLFLFIFYLISPISVNAQTATSSATPYNYQLQTTNFPPQSPQTASVAIYNFSHAMSCILIGQSPIAPCLEYKIIKNAQGVVSSVPFLSSTNSGNGVLGMSLSMIGAVIGTPPIRSSEFIANLGEQIGIKSANAQVNGSGSSVLSPIFKLWEVSRNISYLAMILIFVFVGLMVMFRQKLNPQTVVTIQMALPGLVIGLIMITFSYFLASLISDIAFLGVDVVGYYFQLADSSITQPTQLPLTPKGSNSEDNSLTIFSRYIGIVGTSDIKGVLDSVWPFLKDPNSSSVPIAGGLLGVTGITTMDPQQAISILANMITIQFLLPFGSLIGGKGQAVAAAIPSVITLFNGSTFLIAYSVSWIAMIALIYSMIRLLLRLINNLLSVIFLTISAPFFFLMASVPGRQALGTTWIFNMLCNVLAFPAVFAVFYFVAFLLHGQTSNGTEPLFAIGSGASSISDGAIFPLLGGLKLDFLNKLIAFGALLATPSIPDVICKAVGKPSAFGGAISGAISGGIAGGQRYQGQARGGISGLAGNIGRLDNQPGYIVRPVAKKGGGFTYEFHKPEDETEGRLASGVQRGQWSKFTEGTTGFAKGFVNLGRKITKKP